MNPSMESLLHGESDEEKSCYEESLTGAQHSIIEGRTRSRFSFLNITSFLSLILNIILITLLLFQWVYANDLKPSEYGRLAPMVSPIVLNLSSWPCTKYAHRVESILWVWDGEQE